MHYIAHADLAFASVEHIMRDVNYVVYYKICSCKWRIYVFHGCTFTFLEPLYYGSYKSPREMIWIIGTLIYFLMMATAF